MMSRRRTSMPPKQEASPEQPTPHSVGNRGVLSVVATPIGNLGDLSPRALEVLRSADVILAEDTRHFSVLAKSFDITGRVESYHDHNERRRAPEIVQRLEHGLSIALVSDAGTPTVSDPGYHVLRAARAAGIKIVALPGPCAAIAALSISGFETHRFQFDGFLPVKPGKRKKLLEEALARDFPTILYESPLRIAKVLGEIVALDDETEVFVAREMTKIHEEAFRGTITAALAWMNARPQKGELVLILRGSRSSEHSSDADEVVES